MIALFLTVCLISTGECSTLKADQSYGSMSDCDVDGQKMATAAADALEGLDIRPAGWTCRVDPDGIDG